MAQIYDRVVKLPTANANFVDTIYRYVGSTNNEYTHNKYYKCVHYSKTKSRTEGGSIFDSLTYEVENTHNGDMEFNLYVPGVVSSVDVLDENNNIYQSFGQVKEKNSVSGIIPKGYTLQLIYSAYNGHYTLDYNWYEWQEIQVDEHDVKKYMSRDNMIYFLNELVYRINN